MLYKIHSFFPYIYICWKQRKCSNNVEKSHFILFFKRFLNADFETFISDFELLYVLSFIFIFMYIGTII